MLTIDLMGGLGNQLFQIFTLIAYSLESKNKFYFQDCGIAHGHRKVTYWDNLLKNLAKYINRPLQSIVFRESEFHYIPLPQLNSDINYKLFGYFQSPKYFEKYNNLIFHLIGLEEQKKQIITDHNYANSVSLHFRIGDYAHLQQCHPIMDLTYYKSALYKLIKTTDKDNWNIIYFFEKQDAHYINSKITELKEEFKFLSFIPIEHKYADWEQVLIMSNCAHNIIANSTFSWWGAYFNTNINKLVYYPSVWFGPALKKNNTKDLFPENWIKI